MHWNRTIGLILGGLLLVFFTGLGFALVRGRRLARRQLERMRRIVKRELGCMPPRVARRGISEETLLFLFVLSLGGVGALAHLGLWGAVPVPLSVVLADLYWTCGETLFKRRMERGDYSAALTVADRRLRLTPASWSCLQMRGHALLSLGRHAEAAAALQTALAEAPGWFEGWTTLRDLGPAVTCLKQPEEAARILRAASALGAEIPAECGGSA